MISLLLSRYKQYDKELLLQSLALAQSELLQGCDIGCSYCKKRRVCNDLDRAIDHLKSIL